MKLWVDARISPEPAGGPFRHDPVAVTAVRSLQLHDATDRAVLDAARALRPSARATPEAIGRGACRSAARRQLLRDVRILFGDPPLDRDACTGDEAHRKSSRRSRSRSWRISTSAGVWVRPLVRVRCHGMASPNAARFAAMPSSATHSRMWRTSPSRARWFSAARRSRRSTPSASRRRTLIVTMGLPPRAGWQIVVHPAGCGQAPACDTACTCASASGGKPAAPAAGSPGAVSRPALPAAPRLSGQGAASRTVSGEQCSGGRAMTRA